MKNVLILLLVSIFSIQPLFAENETISVAGSDTGCGSHDESSLSDTAQDHAKSRIESECTKMDRDDNGTLDTISYGEPYCVDSNSECVTCTVIATADCEYSK